MIFKSNTMAFFTTFCLVFGIIADVVCYFTVMFVDIKEAVNLELLVVPLGFSINGHKTFLRKGNLQKTRKCLLHG